MTWQPIETAPKDGTEILAYYPSCQNEPCIRVVSWWGGYECETCGARALEGWGGDKPYDFGRWQPTHWMPLPPFPDDRATRFAFYKPKRDRRDYMREYMRRKRAAVSTGETIAASTP